MGEGRGEALSGTGWPGRPLGGGDSRRGCTGGGGEGLGSSAALLSHLPTTISGSPPAEFFLRAGTRGGQPCVLGISLGTTEGARDPGCLLRPTPNAAHQQGCPFWPLKRSCLHRFSAAPAPHSCLSLQQSVFPTVSALVSSGCCNKLRQAW